VFNKQEYEQQSKYINSPCNATSTRLVFYFFYIYLLTSKSSARMDAQHQH
jgi:hypothetical protein